MSVHQQKKKEMIHLLIYKNRVQSCELGEAKYLLNTVYESGFDSAMLWMDPGNGFYVRLHFLWSPDSIPL